MLGAATFVGVSTELLPIGLLPAISTDLATSEGAAGLAVTGYALVVALAATPLTAATSGWPRRRVLLAVLFLYAASTAVAAAAPTLPVLLAARMLGGLCHGVFWSMIAGYAARLVPADRVGRATSAVFTGNALAVAVGLPVSTAAGQAFGWRAAFVGAAVATGVVALAAWLVLPPVAADRPAETAAGVTGAGGPSGPVRSALARPGVRAVALFTGLVVLGLYTFFSYITVYLREVGASDGVVSAALLAYGVAGVVGTRVLGPAYDRRPVASFGVTTAALLCALAALAVLGVVPAARWVPVAAVVATTALGCAAISLPVTLQAMVLRHGGPTPDAASSLFVAAFNLGISGGALTGALVLTTVGSAVLPLTAVVIAAAAALFALRSSSFGATAGPPGH